MKSARFNKDECKPINLGKKATAEIQKVKVTVKRNSYVTEERLREDTGTVTNKSTTGEEKWMLFLLTEVSETYWADVHTTTQRKMQ